MTTMRQVNRSTWKMGDSRLLKPATKSSTSASPINAMRAGIALLVFAGLLPLQWDVLAATPVGTVRYFHLGAVLLLVLGAPALRSKWRLMRSVSFPIVPAFFASSVVLTFTSVVFGGSVVNPAQAFAYLLIGIAVGACLLEALGHSRARAAVALSGVAAATTALGGMWAGFRVNGIDLLAAYALAAQGQQGPMLHGYRLVFEAGDGMLRSQARHEVFAAMLFAAMLSYAVGSVPRVLSIVRALAMIVVVVLVVLSLSRALLLVLVLLAVLPLARLCRGGRLSPWSLFAAVVALIGGMLAWDFVSGLISGRLDDTRSYEGRISSLDAFSASDATSRILLGGGPVPVSTHNMVLDALLLGGVVAFVASAFVVWRILILLAASVSRYADSGRYLDAVAAAAGLLACVRIVTSGGGQLHLVSWAAIGVLIAASVYARNQPRAAK